jgi:hypothetical protein
MMTKIMSRIVPIDIESFSHIYVPRPAEFATAYVMLADPVVELCVWRAVAVTEESYSLIGLGKPRQARSRARGAHVGRGC